MNADGTILLGYGPGKCFFQDCGGKLKEKNCPVDICSEKKTNSMLGKSGGEKNEKIKPATSPFLLKA